MWLYPRIILSKSHGNTSMYADIVINFAKITTYIHIHTTYTYYIQNQWSHSLFLNYVQARQKWLLPSWLYDYWIWHIYFYSTLVKNPEACCVLPFFRKNWNILEIISILTFWIRIIKYNQEQNEYKLVSFTLILCILNKRGEKWFLHLQKEVLKFAFCVCIVNHFSNHVSHDKWNSAKNK